MQINPNANAGGSKKTGLIIALICIPFAFGLVMIIFVAGTMFWAMTSQPYMKWTAKAQPEIIKIEAATWRENNSTGMSKSPGGTHEVKGFIVSYKFTTADGQTIFHTADRHRSSEPSDMAVVCYKPKDPQSCGLYSVNTTCPIR